MKEISYLQQNLSLQRVENEQLKKTRKRKQLLKQDHPPI